MIWLIVVAIMVVAVLSAVAAYYLWRVRQLRKSQHKSVTEHTAAYEKERQKRINSIHILAQGVLDDQLTMTEAAIRIGVLLDSLGVDESVRERYRVFYQLAEKTAHIPILENWKKLSSKEQRRFTKEREVLEAQFHDFIRQAAKNIRSDSF
ncbi:DUF2489 domain-containing protein [Marinibactrum halimedae]|uniref:DUF2489 domain-containing protein n=1 Tax=Marinibactrum halimedae TaxID=1444977 RepID=A0AA37WP00_9GAMM|nr:DUF2489 domain-containing protein [Marinibactrum halimedae]MCD9460751.1 DUF2489 domain-containing protein [Marinibactrum halimedae]GLS26676.1 hypothetical protein GCM10007877_23930 [Marinibactrum halimedae]